MIKDEDKTKEQLIKELVELRKILHNNQKSQAEQKKMEKALRESEAMLHTVIENLPFDFWCIDRSGRYILQNSICRRRWGETIGKRPVDLDVDESNLALWLDNNQRAFAGEVVKKEVELTVKGTKGYYYNIITPVYEGKEIIAILGVNVDITDRKRAEEALRRYEKIASTSRDYMAFVDRNYIYQTVNDAYLRTHRKERHQIEGHSIKEIFGHDFFEKTIQPNVDRCFQGEEVHYQWWMTLPEEEPRCLDVIYCPYFEPDGTVSGIVVNARDLTEIKKAEELLIESEERYRNVYNTSPLAFVLWERECRITDWNEHAEKIFGWSREEVIGRNFFEFLIPKGAKPHVEVIVDNLLRGELPSHSINENLTKSGKIILCEWNNSIRYDKRGQVLGVISLALDITERKRNEEALKLTQFTVDRAADAVFWIQPDARIIYVNDIACSRLGYSREELLNMTISNIDPNYTLNVWPEHWKRIKRKGSLVIESSHRAKNGRLFPVEITINYIEFDGKEFNCSFARDITERKKTEQQIKTSLKEKEVLLKEIHHRVKNNMQFISSLLKLQSNYIKDDVALEMFMECQNRIETMALIHENLYQTKDLSNIDYNKYIENLAETLFSLYRTDKKRIVFKHNIGNVLLSIDDAISCGLIMNELISNALKYAFPDGRDGEIQIALSTKADNQIELIVSDNGVGLPQNLNIRDIDSLGLLLVNILTEQLRGELEIDRSNGTKFKITYQRKNSAKP